MVLLVMWIMVSISLLEIRIKQTNKNKKNFTDMVSF